MASGCGRQGWAWEQGRDHSPTAGARRARSSGAGGSAPRVRPRPLPLPARPGVLPGAGLQDAPAVVPDSGCGRGRLLNKGQSLSV